MSHESPYVRPKGVPYVLDVGRTKYYEPGGVRFHPSFPKAVVIPGVGKRFIRRELEDFAELLVMEARAEASEAPLNQRGVPLP